LGEVFIDVKVDILAFVIKETEVEKDIPDLVLTDFSCKPSLSKDWLSTEEDNAWNTL
jgi:hypothetical protein